MNEDVEPTRPSINFIARHWRGELPLWVSYWVINFVASIAVATLTAAISRFFDVNAGYNPYVILLGLASLWGGYAAIVVWQVVGVWRSAGRYAEEWADLGKPRRWGHAAKLMVILGILRFGFEVFQGAAPQLAEGWRMAFRGDPDIPDFSLRVMRKGTEIEIAGGFKYGLHSEFLKLLGTAPGIRVVHLHSPGGRTGEAEKVFRTIRTRGLITYVPLSCLSACTIAFLGGNERLILPDATLGFHRAAFAGVEDETEFSVAYKESNVGSWFLTKVMSTPHSDMWYPTQLELRRAAVITGIASWDRFSISGLGSNLSKERIVSLVSADPVLSALKEARPDDFEKVIAIWREHYLAGSSSKVVWAATR